MTRRTQPTGSLLTHEGRRPTTLAYPVRGLGELWTAPADPPDGLAGVFGVTRARLLVGLGRPATTSALAARHGLSAASVSGQLAHLSAAGLAVGTRTGRDVFYRRTALAEALLTGDPMSGQLIGSIGTNA